jgi:hypothetical protein
MRKSFTDAHAWNRGYSDALEGKPEDFSSTMFGEAQAGAYGRGWANGAHKAKLAREAA